MLACQLHTNKSAVYIGNDVVTITIALLARIYKYFRYRTLINPYLVSAVRNDRNPLLRDRNVFDMSEMFSTGFLYAGEK